MKKHHLILDCDTKNERDDQFAIAYALAHPQIVLEGVVSVQNNAVGGVADTVERYHREARKLMRLAQSDVPTFKGSRYPLARTEQSEQSRGVAFIIRKARELGARLTLVGTGPATDIAAALLQAPEAMQPVTVVWIGSMLDNAMLRARKSNECNFCGDKVAFAVMTREKKGLVLLPGPGLTDRMVVQCAALGRALRKAGNPLADYLAWLMESSPNKFWVLWDVAAVAVAIGFGIVAEQQAPRCRCTRGRMRYAERGPKSMRLITDIDEFAMLSDMKQRLTQTRRRW
jgi:inosine-uridine nucleoside N-ribohydrolase